jgi:hypothetical protein
VSALHPSGPKKSGTGTLLTLRQEGFAGNVANATGHGEGWKRVRGLAGGVCSAWRDLGRLTGGRWTSVLPSRCPNGVVSHLPPWKEHSSHLQPRGGPFPRQASQSARASPHILKCLDRAGFAETRKFVVSWCKSLRVGMRKWASYPIAAHPKLSLYSGPRRGVQSLALVPLVQFAVGQIALIFRHG